MSKTSIVSGRDLPSGESPHGRASQLFEILQLVQQTQQQMEDAVRMASAAKRLSRDLSVRMHERPALGEEPDFIGYAYDLQGKRVYLQGQVKSTFRQDLSEATADELRTALDASMESLLATSNLATALARTVAQQSIGEPGKLLPGSEIARLLDVSEEAVRLRHQSGKLIAILREGRERGRGFPVFQAWEGIAGAPLEKVLEALGYQGPGKSGPDAADAFQFFTSRNELLGGFTPVEVLTGVGLLEPGDHEAAEFLAKPSEERLEFVISVARTETESRGE